MEEELEKRRTRSKAAKTLEEAVSVIENLELEAIKIKEENRKLMEALNTERDTRVKTIIEGTSDKSREIMELNQRVKDMSNEMQELWRKMPITSDSTPQVSRGKSKIVPQINTFSGKRSESIDTWIFSVENAFNLSEVHKKNWVNIAGNYLRESAQEGFRNMTINSRAENKTFCNLLRNLYRPHNYETKLRKRLYDLRQTGTYSEYLMRFLNIINQIEDMTEKDKVFLFIQNMAPELSTELCYRDPKTMSEAMTIAGSFDRSRKVKQVQPETALMSHVKNQRKTYIRQFKKERNSQSLNHYRYKQKIENPLTCNRCSKQGHKAADCRIPWEKIT